MKKFFTLLLIAASTLSFGQSPFGKSGWEVGIQAGPTVMIGDLGWDTEAGTLGQYDLGSMQIMAGFHARYKFTSRFAVNTTLNGGWVKSDDANGDAIRQGRNLNHRTDMFMLGATPEYYFLKDQEMIGGSGKFSAYVYGGLQMIFFNPKMYIDIEGGYTGYSSLHQWNTEPNEDYSRLTLGIPYGFGVKYHINNKWSVGYRFNQTYTMTDKLDDVGGTYAEFADYDPSEGYRFARGFEEPLTGGSPGADRGNTESNDMFVVNYLTLTYRFDLGEVRRSNFVHFFEFWLAKPGRKKF